MSRSLLVQASFAPSLPANSPARTFGSALEIPSSSPVGPGVSLDCLLAIDALSLGRAKRLTFDILRIDTDLLHPVHLIKTHRVGDRRLWRRERSGMHDGWDEY